MENKLTLKYLAFIVFFGLIAFSAYRIYKDSKAPEEKYIFNEKEEQKEEEKESEILETEEEYIILTREKYSGSYRTTIRLYSTGKLEQSTVLDETTKSKGQKDKYISIGTMKEEDLKVIKDTIQNMSKAAFKQTNFSNNYGISIKLNKKDKIFYSAEYFEQNDVDKLYNIINKY